MMEVKFKDTVWESRTLFGIDVVICAGSFEMLGGGTELIALEKAADFLIEQGEKEFKDSWESVEHGLTVLVDVQGDIRPVQVFKPTSRFAEHLVGSNPAGCVRGQVN